MNDFFILTQMKNVMILSKAMRIDQINHTVDAAGLL